VLAVVGAVIIMAWRGIQDSLVAYVSLTVLAGLCPQVEGIEDGRAASIYGIIHLIVI
jgi:hypothetical protein